VEGKRIYPDEDGHLFLAEGEYGQHRNGTWYARPFGCHAGNLAAHEVTEHEDGTITVSPSILITSHDATWHGYLERGMWREV
jgi:hypothetical protein